MGICAVVPTLHKMMQRLYILNLTISVVTHRRNKMLKNGVPVQLRIDTPFVLYQLNIAWFNIA